MLGSDIVKNNSRLKIVESYPEANILPPLSKPVIFLMIKCDQLFDSNKT